jgi:hypothetical protein
VTGSKFIIILKFIITLQIKVSTAAKILTCIQRIQVLISDRVPATYAINWGFFKVAKIDSFFHPFDVTVHKHPHSMLFITWSQCRVSNGP